MEGAGIQIASLLVNGATFLVVLAAALKAGGVLADLKNLNAWQKAQDRRLDRLEQARR